MKLKGITSYANIRCPFLNKQLTSELSAAFSVSQPLCLPARLPRAGSSPSRRTSPGGGDDTLHSKYSWAYSLPQAGNELSPYWGRDLPPLPPQQVTTAATSP